MATHAGSGQAHGGPQRALWGYPPPPATIFRPPAPRQFGEGGEEEEEAAAAAGQEAAAAAAAAAPSGGGGEGGGAWEGVGAPLQEEDLLPLSARADADSAHRGTVEVVLVAFEKCLSQFFFLFQNYKSELKEFLVSTL